MQDSDAAAAGPRTLRRGLAVLAALRDQGPDGLSVTDIARLTGIQRPTIYRLLAALLDAGSIHPVIDRVFPFAEAKDALAYLARGRARGKVVVRLR